LVSQDYHFGIEQNAGYSAAGTSEVLSKDQVFRKWATAQTSVHASWTQSAKPPMTQQPRSNTKAGWKNGLPIVPTSSHPA